MEAGRRRHRIVLQRKAKTTGEFGGPVWTWSDVATLPASIEQMPGREMMKSQAVFEEPVYRFGINYHPGITTGMRIVYAGRYHDIMHVDNIDERNRNMVITAKLGINEG